MALVMFHTECFTTNLRAIPIMKELAAQKRHQIVPFTTFVNSGAKATSIPLVQKLFKAHGITPVTPDRLGLGNLEKETAAAQKEYQSGFQDTLQQNPALQEIRYRGVPVLKYCWPHILGHNTFKIHFMYLYERVLDRIKPDVVINGYDFGTLKRFCVTVTRDMGIPTIGLQDGVWTNLRAGRVSDYFLVWGDHFKEMHLEGGYEPERLFVTGAPSLDFTRRDDFDRDKLLGMLGLDPARRTVVIGVSVRDLREALDLLLERFDKEDQAQIIIKLHPEFPEDQCRLYQEILDRHRTPAVLVQHQVLDPCLLLWVSDVLLSYHSNLLFEGLALGLELVLLTTDETYQLDPSGRPTSVHFEAETYARTARTASEVVEATVLALERPGELSRSPQADKWRQRLYHRLDGQSSRRSVEAIEEVLKRREKPATDEGSITTGDKPVPDHAREDGPA